MSGFTSGMRSSESGEWTTPRDLFEELDAEFHFDLDAASTDENALCARHYTEAQDGLEQPWSGSVWCNPPYGREIGKWVRKAATDNEGGGLGAARAGADGHGVVARLDRGPCDRGALHSRAAQVRGLESLGAVPERGGRV